MVRPSVPEEWSAVTQDLADAFAEHADESLAIANETFEAAAEVWLRDCVWPDCLSPEQSRRLAEEIEYEEVHGVPQPGRDLTDYRVIHGCVDSGRPDLFGEEPPW